MSNSTQHKFSLIAETTYGETPSPNPTFLTKDITGTTLGLAKGKIESEVIDPMRQVKDVRHGNRQVGGEISTELIFGPFDDMLEALFCGTWASDILKGGVTRRSFSMLRQFTDLGGGALPFQLFTGVEFNTLALTVAPEALVKAVFGVLGKNVTYGATAPTGATYTNSNAAGNRPFDSFTGELLLDGSPVAVVTELQLNIENGLEPRFVVFQDTTNQPKAGKFRVTGQLTAYFQDSSLLVAFSGEVEKSLNFTLTDLNGNSYVFDIPRILPMGGQTDVQGEGDVTVAIPFSAIYSSTDGTAISITRVAD